MKILIFNWRDLKHSWAGGGEIYVFELAKRWVKLGHSVTVFCGEDPEQKLLKHEIDNGIAIQRKGGRYSVYLWAVWYYFSKFRGKFDILVDVENGIPFFTPLFSRIPKVCIVYHIHNTQWFYEIPFPLSYIGFFIEKYIFPIIYAFTPIIAISKTTKEELTKIGFSKKNITIIYSGMNGKKTIKGYGKKFINPTILYLGRIKKYKRVDLLVTLLPEIMNKVPNLRLIIAGWGTQASILANLIMKSPYRRKISLLGPVDENEKKHLLSKAWIFVNPSIGEGWSMAITEANLYGTPAIAFDVPGVKESIQNKKTGLLVKNNEQLIDNIAKILTQRLKRDTLGKNAIKWAKTFDWNKSTNKSLQIFQNLLNNK